MILEVVVANLLSFKDKNILEMNSNIVNIKGELNVGKTNFLKILNYVSIFIKTSENYLSSFAFNNKASSFEITFKKKQIKYTYGFVLNNKLIDKEYLYYYNDKVKTIIYERDKNNYDFIDKTLFDISLKVLDKRLFLSYLKDYDKLKDVYTFLISDIAICFDINTLVESSFNCYLKNKKLKPIVLDIFQKADSNIIDYNIKSIPINNKLGYIIKFSHKLDNNYIIDYGNESLSTRLLFALIPFILKLKEEDKVLIIDDLDRVFDKKIINLIIDILRNSKGQFIFTSRLDNNYDIKMITIAK